MNEQGKMCSRCGENPAQAESVPNLLFLPLVLLLGTWYSDDSKNSRLCSDCAGGINFLGLLASVAILIAGIVVAVIMFTR